MKRSTWGLIVILAVLVVLLLIARAANAGELELHWTAPPSGPQVDGYRIYVGDQPGVYGTPIEVGNVLEHQLVVPDDCTLRHYAVTAFNAAGESEYSTEVSSIARPTITDVTSSQAGAHTILGENFGESAKVWVNATGVFVQVPSGDVQRVSCGEIRIPDIPMVQLKVSNVALPLGSGEPEDIFSQPWPGPASVWVR